MDVNDSVGIMDSHFPDAEFFTEFEQFEGVCRGREIGWQAPRLYCNLFSKLPSPATHEVCFEKWHKRHMRKTAVP